jgi:hypothetical protein
LSVAEKVKRISTECTEKSGGHRDCSEDWRTCQATGRAPLKLVGLLGVAEAGEGVGGAFPVNFYFNGAFGFGAGFAEYGEGSQGFVVNLSNQIGFAGIVLLPDLADLEFAGGHTTNVDRIAWSVNISARG